MGLSAQNQQINDRVVQLLKQGLTTDQIYRRTGVAKRRILRIRAKLKQTI